jgi:hypothetical protein
MGVQQNLESVGRDALCSPPGGGSPRMRLLRFAPQLCLVQPKNLLDDQSTQARRACPSEEQGRPKADRSGSHCPAAELGQAHPVVTTPTPWPTTWLTTTSPRGPTTDERQHDQGL